MTDRTRAPTTQHRATALPATCLALLVPWLLVTSAACDDGTAVRRNEGPQDSGSSFSTRDGGDRPAPPSCGEPDADAGPSTCESGEVCVAGQCVVNTCGDGVRAGAEACDDGNVVHGDGCDPACRRELETCGDAVTQAPEECDDGNVYELDTCSNACTLVACGNGRLDGVEECDDGNFLDFDTCSSACTENRCRNGRLDPGEECDDGNRIHTDFCSNACKIFLCGNGRAEGLEECDDENDVNDDECSNGCLSNACGNGRVDPGEACDGDTVDTNCADDCKGIETMDACRECEEVSCIAYLEIPGFDVLNGCLSATEAGRAARLDYGATVTPDEATFVQECIDVINCARRTACGYGLDASGTALVGPAEECYCGSRDRQTCQVMGPGDDAPCRAEWEAAVRSPAVADVFARAADPTYPAGWAYSLLECDASPAYCRDACLPAQLRD